VHSVLLSGRTNDVLVRLDDSTLNEIVGLPRLTLPLALIVLSVYLTGATLFLSLMLARVFYIVLDFIHVQENYSLLQTKTAKQSGAAGEGEELRKRIRELEAELSTSQSQGRDFGEVMSEIVRTARLLLLRYLEKAGQPAKRRVQ
jgi:hypothetical protein